MLRNRKGLQRTLRLEPHRHATLNKEAEGELVRVLAELLVMAARVRVIAATEGGADERDEDHG